MKAGDKVKILIDTCGYHIGDIGTIVTPSTRIGCFIVFVPDRISNSNYRPNVSFRKDHLELIEGKQNNESWKQYYGRK